MKVPATCPICQQPMTNDFIQYKRSEILVKKCNHPSHHLRFDVDIANNIVVSCILTINEKQITWYPETKLRGIVSHPIIIVHQKEASAASLPYFEPNFANYPALLNKLKTYMVFS